MLDKEATKENFREGRKQCRECERKRDRKKTREMRREVIDYYSQGMNKCRCCGEATYAFLFIHHIDGDGGKFRKERGRSSGSLVRWLIHNHLPPGFDILCGYCNAAIGALGKCSHQERALEEKLVARAN